MRMIIGAIIVCTGLFLPGEAPASDKLDMKDAQEDLALAQKGCVVFCSDRLEKYGIYTVNKTALTACASACAAASELTSNCSTCCVGSKIADADADAFVSPRLKSLFEYEGIWYTCASGCHSVYRFDFDEWKINYHTQQEMKKN